MFEWKTLKVNSICCRRRMQIHTNMDKHSIFLVWLCFFPICFAIPTSKSFINHWSLKFELAIGSPHTVPPNITLLGAKMNWSSTRPNRPCGWRIVRGIFRNLIPHTVTSLGTSPLHCWVQKQCLHSLRLTWGLLKVTFVIFASHCATSLPPYRLKAMTHIDDSLAVPTSENFGVNVSTDDRPIWTEDSESLIDVDRVDFFFIF